MSNEVALLTSAVLLGTAVVALFSKRVSISLIMLFYSSVTLGVIFTLYGSVLVGLLHIITFAGAVSVLMLTAILMIGEAKLEIRANAAAVALLGALLVVVVLAAYQLLSALPSGAVPATALPPGGTTPVHLALQALGPVNSPDGLRLFYDSCGQPLLQGGTIE